MLAEVNQITNMAAPISKGYDEFFKEVVQTALKHVGILMTNVPLTKRSNDFNHGDYYIPAGCIKEFKEPVCFHFHINSRYPTLRANAALQNVLHGIMRVIDYK